MGGGVQSSPDAPAVPSACPPLCEGTELPDWEHREGRLAAQGSPGPGQLLVGYDQDLSQVLASPLVAKGPSLLLTEAIRGTMERIWGVERMGWELQTAVVAGDRGGGRKQGSLVESKAGAVPSAPLSCMGNTSTNSFLKTDSR